MRRVNWIKRFEPLDENKLLEAVFQTEKWVDQNSHIDGDARSWDIIPGKEQDPGGLLLKDTSIYAGAAGISLFYLRLYISQKEDKWLQKAKAGLEYVIRKYKGTEDFYTDSKFLPGADIGFLSSPAGGAYVASRLYEITGDEKYKDFALRVTDDCIAAAHEENGALVWYGSYGIIGEGSLILYLLDAYKTYQKQEYLIAAKKAAKLIIDKKEDAPHGGYRWYAMPTDIFPTIRKAGGYFPGFEYGAAGCGFILASVYEYTREEEYLRVAKEAARYILNIADYSEDGEAALVRYNDTYLTDLYYLGVCQGPVGTSRLFFKLYELTHEEKYREFIEQLTRGLLSTGAPAKHSEGYWRTNCYCCGAPGMLEHFINMHKFTGKKEYLYAAYEAAETIIGESTYTDPLRKWYTAWNRHEPEKSEAYTGLYHGSLGCASSLLFLSQYIAGKDYITPYLEDPYKTLFISKEE
jgi:lantibiotic modifying enzyme